MISREEYIQLKAFARQDGLLMGILWVVSLACFVGSMRDPLLEIGFIIGFISTPVVMYLRLKSFRDKVLGGSITYLRSVAFCAHTFAYASLIVALATLAYFYFWDDGMLISTLRNNIQIPEVRESFIQAGMKPEELESQIDSIGNLRAIDFAFSIFVNSLVTSFILSLILGFAGRRRKY